MKKTTTIRGHIFTEGPPSTDSVPWATGSNPDGSFVALNACASCRASCLNTAEKNCAGCLVVQYCSKECQKNDWPRHKQACHQARIKPEKTCPDFEQPNYDTEYPLEWVSVEDADGNIVTRRATEKEIDEYNQTYNVRPNMHLARDGTEATRKLWGGTPPIDLLNLPTNEGSDYQKDLSIYIGGVSDLRHVMKTIVSLPEGYTNAVSFVIPEQDFNLQVRLFLVLMLSANYPDGQAAELITHLWYSAWIPSKMYNLVIDKVLPHLKKALDGTTREGNRSVAMMVGQCTVSLSMRNREWAWLDMRLNPQNFEKKYKAEWKRESVMMCNDPFQRKARDDFLSSLPPWQRLTELEYRQTGILLPYGSDVEHFNISNPTFWTTSKQFILHPLASPLDNHDLPKLHETCVRLGLPPNDFHGAAFFETRGLVKKFCSRLAKLETSFISTTCHTKNTVSNFDELMTTARTLVGTYEEEGMQHIQREITRENTDARETGTETGEEAMQHIAEEALHEDDSTILEAVSETREETPYDNIISTHNAAVAALEKERDIAVIEAARAMLDLSMAATITPETPSLEDSTVCRIFKDANECLDKMAEVSESEDLDQAAKTDSIKQLERETMRILEDGASDMEAIMNNDSIQELERETIKMLEDRSTEMAAINKKAQDEAKDAAIKQIAQFDRMMIPPLLGHLNDQFADRIERLAPLLRPRESNPHAAIISLLVGPGEIGNSYLNPKQNFRHEAEALLPHKWYVYSGQLNTEMAHKKSLSVNSIRQEKLDALTLHQQKCWNIYVERMATKTIIEAVGLVLKKEHEMSISPAWPFRLVMSGTDAEREEQYWLRFGSRMKGGERFVELGLSERGAVVDDEMLMEGNVTRYDTLIMLSGDPMNHVPQLTDDMMETAA